MKATNMPKELALPRVTVLNRLCSGSSFCTSALARVLPLTHTRDWQPLALHRRDRSRVQDCSQAGLMTCLLHINNFYAGCHLDLGPFQRRLQLILPQYSKSKLTQLRMF